MNIIPGASWQQNTIKPDPTGLPKRQERTVPEVLTGHSVCPPSPPPQAEHRVTFPHILALAAMARVLQWLEFCNDLGDAESMNPGVVLSSGTRCFASCSPFVVCDELGFSSPLALLQLCSVVLNRVH